MPTQTDIRMPILWVNRKDENKDLIESAVQSKIVTQISIVSSELVSFDLPVLQTCDDKRIYGKESIKRWYAHVSGVKPLTK